MAIASAENGRCCSGLRLVNETGVDFPLGDFGAIG
jgi:hypothetical protein